MVVKRISAVLKLGDSCLSRALTRSEAKIYVDGAQAAAEYKQGGYFVLVDLPEGRHHIVIDSFRYQREELDIDVDYSDISSAERLIHCIMLNPSQKSADAQLHPAVSGRAEGFGFVYIVRSGATLKVAEDNAAAGSTCVKLFCAGSKPALPAVFRICGKNEKNSELVTIKKCLDDDTYQLEQPLKYPHARSAEFAPLIRVRCDGDGNFYFRIPGSFSPEKDSGKIHLTIIGEKGDDLYSAEAEAAVRGLTELNEISFKKGK